MKQTINQLSIGVGLIVATIFLVSATWCHAQRGTMSFVSSSLVAPPVAKQAFLTWDNPPGASNRIAWGLSRGGWTNGVQLMTNRWPVTNGLHYIVTAIVAGIESTPALWPSNRIGELWLTGMTTNLTQGTNITRLLKFTNAPPGNMQLWGVANITTGWE